MHEDASEMLANLVSLYKNGKPCPWRVASAARLKAIWKSAAELGFVRDEKGLDEIADLFVNNIQRIQINNIISGHEAVSADEELAEYFDKDEIEAFVDWAIETPTGGWRISDYGIEPLMRLASLLIGEDPDAEEKLQLCDAILNVVHPRSDLASWFVQGGSMTASELADYIQTPEA